MKDQTAENRCGVERRQTKPAPKVRKAKSRLISLRLFLIAQHLVLLLPGQNGQQKLLSVPTTASLTTTPSTPNLSNAAPVAGLLRPPPSPKPGSAAHARYVPGPHFGTFSHQVSYQVHYGARYGTPHFINKAISKRLSTFFLFFFIVYIHRAIFFFSFDLCCFCWRKTDSILSLLSCEPQHPL